MHEDMIMGCVLVMSRQSGQITQKPSSTVLPGLAPDSTTPTMSLTRIERAKIASGASFPLNTLNSDCKDNPNSGCRLEVSPCSSHGDRPDMPAAYASSSALVETFHRVKVAPDRLSKRRIAPVDRHQRNIGELGFTGRKRSKLRSCPI